MACREHVIPAEIRALDVLPSDYVDLFVASLPDASLTSPEAWARAAVEGAARTGRFLAWRVACRLRLGPDPSPGFIGGWQIADQGKDYVRLEAASAFMTANMVFRVEADRVYFATLIRYDRDDGRLVWTPVSAVHRAVAPSFLNQAVRRVARGTS